jgi:hypothetical protein
MGTTKRTVLVTWGLVVLLGGAACAGSGDSSSGAGESADAFQTAPSIGRRRLAPYGSDDALVSAAVATLPAAGPSVIKTADVSIRVRAGSLQRSTQDLVAIAQDNQGFVLSSSVVDDAGHSGEVVLRVPAGRFEIALSDIDAVGNVVRKQVSGQDVGEEFVDLEARLRNFEAQESVLLRLMAKSTSVADTLRVQRELQDVQLEIERLRGRIRFLRDQTDLSTIRVDVSEAGVTVAEMSSIARAWHRAIDTFNAVVSGVVISLGVLIPLALLLALVLLLARVLRSRLASWWPRDA